jgi:hypothetical protein
MQPDQAKQQADISLLVLHVVSMSLMLMKGVCFTP